MASVEAFHAVTRFGLGPKGDELAQLGDPRGWLAAQLRAPVIPPEVLVRVGGDRLLNEKDEKKMLVDANGRGAPIRQVYLEESAARFTAQVNSTQPLIERMVLFWSNHFTVSMQKGIVAGLANRYEVEAIRPHVTGYFKDMLLSVAQHPAMLLYLDNAISVGPNSVAGQRRGKGLNENLAREILELHTLGVNGGYSQGDVTSFARILTGWSFEAKDGGDGRILRYQFQPRLHEPGSKPLLGRTFAEGGEQEGIAALTMLAEHPATARHIATKLAVYFISDTPPASAIDALAASFTKSGGHLGEVTETLIALKESWQQPLAKFKDPYDYVLSIFRLIGRAPEQKMLFNSLEALDYRMFNALSPAGYSAMSGEWAAPDAVKKRIEFAYRFAQSMPATADPMALAARAIGPVMKPTTQEAIQRAASGKDGIALFFASPEFLRR